MKHHKNLAQFLDTRKAAQPWESWVHILPFGAVSATHAAANAYSMASYSTYAPEGLRRPVIVPDGKAFLGCLSDNPEHEITCVGHNLLIVTWEKKIPQPALELANDDGTVTKIKQEPIYEKQQAEFSIYGLGPEDPPLTKWNDTAMQRPVLRHKRHGIRADQLKILSALKEGQLKSKDEPANLTITMREGCATFRLPNCQHNFAGVVTTNKMNGET